MQDLLVYVTRGLAAVTTQLRAQHIEPGADINHLVTLNLFITITNANFDKAAIVERIHRTLQAKRALLAQVTDPAVLPEAARWTGQRMNLLPRLRRWVYFRPEMRISARCVS